MLDESEIVRIIMRERFELLSYIATFLDDAHLAEDCLQDTCAAAVAQQDFFQDASHVIRWTLRVGRNKAIDLVRRRNRQPLILDEDILEQLEHRWTDCDPLPASEATTRTEALRSCLAALTTSSRQIVELRYVDGLKSSRIAELLGRKVDTIYRALTRALGTLRECMQKKLSAQSE